MIKGYLVDIWYGSNLTEITKKVDDDRKKIFEIRFTWDVTVQQRLIE